MNILITGATGFIGSFIVEEALKRNMNVWVAVRKTSSRKYLTDERIKFLELDFDDTQQMKREMKGLEFDYVVHAAGLTKCIDSSDFYRVNTDGTRHLVEALLELKMPLKRFVYLSSLSVCGAVCEEQPYADIDEDTAPQPNTEYGKSKLKAENYLQTVEGLPYIVLRPTGVYGPRERDYFLMAKSIRQHVDFSVGYKPQVITFIYVLDVVQAVFLSLDNGVVGHTYIISDGKEYDSRTFSDLIRRELGNPWLLRIKAPLWLLRIITFAGEHIGRMTGRISALNNDKYNIMRQRNWKCDISRARRELGYDPAYDLERGVVLTMKWYKENKWI
ncbi:MAG: NAD-dependent epimerase/dehydratase family protein [Prevotella sp.]